MGCWEEFHVKSLRARVAVLCTAIVLPLTAASGAQHFPSPSGVWLTDGYDRVARFNGDVAQWYQITQISCMKTAHMQREGGSATEADYVLGGDDIFRLTQGPTTDTLWSHEDGSVSSVLMVRAKTMPKVCDAPVPNTPMENYAIFWQSFAENYPFFALRGMDWGAVDRKYRPLVTAATTPKALFDIMQAMIEPLHDSHTYIDAKSLKLTFHGLKPTDDPMKKKSGPRILAIETNYAHGKLTGYCQNQFQFGMLTPTIAYLRINNFGGYCVADGTFARFQAAFDDTLDRIFKDAHSWSGLVVDVRINGGGADPFGISIASRLTAKPYLAYSKVIRDDIHDPDRRSAPQPVMVPASVRPGFRGPVVLLTSRDSHSAAETFTMALMARAPHITRIGDPTQGVFSDVLNRVLPNGWTFLLPNEIFLDKTGNAYDVTGVPPDIALTPFAADDLASGRDSDLNDALRILASKRGL
jgi:Peptidase family S41/Tricorn protease C1 domain